MVACGSVRKVFWLLTHKIVYGGRHAAKNHIVGKLDQKLVMDVLSLNKFFVLVFSDIRYYMT